LTVRGSGDSEIERLPDVSWFRSLEEVYRDVGQGNQLGYRGGIGYEPPPLYFPFGKGKPHAVGLFKFEAIAVWCIPADRRLPEWKHSYSDLEVYWIDKAGKKHSYKSDVEPTPDGPTGRFLSTMRSGIALPTGETTRVFSWDAPRLAVMHPPQGNTYYLSGDWTVRVSDSQNAWEAKVRIEFSFKDDAPEQGVGKMTILERPHPVSR
jgi:hypothetical protein